MSFWPDQDVWLAKDGTFRLRDRKRIPKCSGILIQGTISEMNKTKATKMVIYLVIMFMTWWQEKTNLQIQFLGFSRDVYHLEIISISPIRTTTFTRRSQHKRELPRLSIPTQLAHRQRSWQICRIDQQPNNSPYTRSILILWPLTAKLRTLSCSKMVFIPWSRWSQKWRNRWK